MRTAAHHSGFSNTEVLDLLVFTGGKNSKVLRCGVPHFALAKKSNG